jgi:hypothetical protein
MHLPLAIAGGTVVSVLLVVLLVGGWLFAKGNAMKSTKCIHCGHDSGVTGAQAPICAACGRNRTVLNHRKARKR